MIRRPFCSSLLVPFFSRARVCVCVCVWDAAPSYYHLFSKHYISCAFIYFCVSLSLISLVCFCCCIACARSFFFCSGYWSSSLFRLAEAYTRHTLFFVPLFFPFPFLSLEQKSSCLGAFVLASCVVLCHFLRFHAPPVSFLLGFPCPIRSSNRTHNVETFSLFCLVVFLAYTFATLQLLSARDTTKRTER